MMSLPKYKLNDVVKIYGHEKHSFKIVHVNQDPHTNEIFYSLKQVDKLIFWVAEREIKCLSSQFYLKLKLGLN